MINSFTKHKGIDENMIVIQKSKTADSRTCDSSKVSMVDLYDSSIQHIGDVEEGMRFFINKMEDAIDKHDHDKLTGIESFYHDFRNNFETTEWWDNHRKVNRHHLFQEDGVPEDVDLVDVIELVVDCVMAGLGRSGEVYDLDINPEVLIKAFNNTVELLKQNVIVEEE